MQFHKHLYLLKSHIKKIIGISESLIAIGVDLTNLDQGCRVDQNVGGTLNVTKRGHKLQNATNQRSLFLLDPKICLFKRSYCK